LITNGIIKNAANTNLKKVKKYGSISLTASFVNTHAAAHKKAINNIIKNIYRYFFLFIFYNKLLNTILRHSEQREESSLCLVDSSFHSE